MKNGHLAANPASDLDLPKVEQRLPKAALTAAEAEAVLAVPDERTISGLRDRCMLEVLYCTGKIPKQHKPTAGTYWHGCAPGLGVGDEVIPASELDKLPEVYRVPDYATCDPSQAYVTSILDAARTFAALYIDWSGPLPAHRPGAVYRVQPLGPVVEDPDYAGSQAFFSCERATVLEVMETGLTMVSEATQLAVLQFQHVGRRKAHVRRRPVARRGRC
ncbi:MAG TPA: hypothetical protein H9987_00570 [Candidatus Luteococcus avicola]|nr:hypothetical protein [Candidatus Luteococcus avicola]